MNPHLGIFGIGRIEVLIGRPAETGWLRPVKLVKQSSGIVGGRRAGGAGVSVPSVDVGP